jgi:hypothetical protein
VYYSFLLPVVIKATADDHETCRDLMYPAAPDTCGPETGYRANEIK